MVFFDRALRDEFIRTFQAAEKAVECTQTILNRTAAGAVLGAWTCAVGGAVIGAAVPSIATGAIVVGVVGGIFRIVEVLDQRIDTTECGKTNTAKRLRIIAKIASVFIGLYAGAAAATALGMPIGIKTAALLCLGALPSAWLVVVPAIAAILAI